MSKESMVVNAIRILTAEGVQKAKSGHPGMPMGAAPAAYAIWGKQMKHNPADPKWANRDRFVLSSGHGSMLIYSLLHLFGYGLKIDDLKQFRQFGSLTPGHPEYGHTIGVETTTGPLGQGIANAVGMAMAEKHLAAKFNREGFNVVDHYTWCILGDGCMMEGISHEACSLAGTLKLNKLIAVYDDNEISIEGSTDLAFREDVPARFRAYGWNVIDVKEGNCWKQVDAALQIAKTVGCKVIAATQREEKFGFLEDADVVIPDDGRITGKVFGANKAIDLIGPKSLMDTLTAVEPGGIVCCTALIGGVYSIEDFNPLKDIPNGVYLTGFDSDNPTQKDVDNIFVFLDQNNLSPSVGAVYDFTNIREALMDLDSVKTNGKIVVMMEDFDWG